MPVQYVQLRYLSAFLNTDFGLQLACRKLGKTPEEIEAVVGRYTRGKRKGQLRGKLTWAKVEQGGWVRQGYYDHDARQANGWVCRAVGLTFNYAIVDAWDDTKPALLAEPGYNNEDPTVALYWASQYYFNKPKPETEPARPSAGE